jgi:hypothetical protein
VQFGRALLVLEGDMDISLQELWQMEMDQLDIERKRNSPDDVIWKWSPLDIREFDIMLHIAYSYYAVNGPYDSPRQISFAETGSGIGTKLYLAKHKYQMIEYGYEINRDYVNMAQGLGVQCEVRDLTKDPAPIWAAYDIVYTCRPLKDDIAEANWERSVQAAMRPGAVLIAAFVAVKPYDWPCFYRRPFRGIWVKPGIAPDPDTVPAEAALANLGRR